MDKLPPDLLRKIVTDFRPYELLEFCLVSSPLNDAVCNSHDFWVQRLELDFPYVIEFFSQNNLRLNDPKGTYSKFYTKLTLGIENVANTYVKQIDFKDNRNPIFVAASRNFTETFNGNINKLLLDAYLDLIELVYVLQSSDIMNYNNYTYKNQIANFFDFNFPDFDLHPDILDYIHNIIEKYNGTEEWIYPLYYLIYTALTKIELPYNRLFLDQGESKRLRRLK